VGEAQGAVAADLSGTIQNDVLKEYMARGTYIYPPAPSMRLICDTFEYCAKVMPKFNPISISGYHIREAGSTAAQEIAFTLADGVAYVEAAVQRGLDVDSFAGRLSFFFNVHNDFLEEVAKFRAARRMWARLLKERFKAKDPRSWALRFHAQTAGSTLTAQQPDNNVVRVALQAFAAVLGGAQSLHTNGRDEALALPTEASARLALRTQQIIACESGVCDLIDPLGGAYALEALTDDLEAKATAYLEKIDGMGGMVEAIARGYPQREIEEAAFLYQREIEDKARVIVGVNEFVNQTGAGSGEAPMELLKVDPQLEVEQVARLEAFRAARDSGASQGALDALRAAARGRENLMVPIVAAVKARATLGEIANAMREVFGEHGRRG
jgi:methylmalonyl-CoA mutase N-terminal domain/subunit